MKLEDIKFRYIIPISERNERDEPGFLYNGKRLTACFENRPDDDSLTYEDFFVGEASAYLMVANGNARAIEDQVVDDFTFPSGASVADMCLAYSVVKGRRPNWGDDKIQKGIIDYFSATPIAESDELEKFFGYPY